VSWRRRHCVVVGAGLTGATAAHRLIELNWDVTVFEAESSVGGNLRTASLHGVPYEPHGPHVFHTDSLDAYDVMRRHVQLNNYRHRVEAEIPGGRSLTWPLQLGELKRLEEWSVIAAELDARPGRPEGADFETYAVQLMGPTLYDWLCDGYTRKQWGVEPRTLSSRFAPKRLDLRDDGDPSMFRDRYQGYAVGGWHRAVESLLKSATVQLNQPVWLDTLPSADAYVVTAPIDQFLGVESLPWRGVRTEPTYHPDGKAHRLPAPVVNTSDVDVPHTRRVETVQMRYPSGSMAPPSDGTVIVKEYPGAPVRHYPVDDLAGENRRRHADLARVLRHLEPRLVLAGRLANYVYCDMDQAIMQGLNAARRIDEMTRSIK
jgi:UDP-galactopyranose mutase